MGGSKREAQVGLAVILAAVILVVGVMWFKQYRFAAGQKSYAVEFPAVDGLQERDRVQVRGIRMGSVDEFKIVGDVVRVTFHVDEEADLRADAQIKLTTVGIVGEMVVEIDPGTGDAVPEGHVFQGEETVSLPEMTTTANDALADIRGLAGDLHDFFAELRAGDRLPNTLAAAERAASNLDTLLGDNREDLGGLIRDFRASAGALREALAGPDSALASVLTGASRAFDRADSVLTNLERATASLTEIAARLERGQGTAGQLLADDGLYSRADSVLTRVDDLIGDIKRNPRKYFKFSLLDF